MATEPITGQTYQEAGSLQTDALQNAQLDYFAAWLNCVVLSVGDTAPPGSPTNGDRYIVGASATGEWATHDDALAVYRDGWQFYAPTAGVWVKDLATGDDYEFVGSGPAWTVKGGGGGSLADGDYGDVTVSGSGTAIAIDAGAVTYAKMQDVSATQRVIGRNTAGSGDAEEVSLTQLLDWVGSAADGDILYRSGGSWTRLGAGSDGQVLTLDSGLPTWAAGGGGGLTNFAEGVNSSSPNATIPYVSLTATNAATNVDAAIIPKGTGAFTLAVADGLSSGGNKRGTRAVDLQMRRGSSGSVASGQESFAAGYNNTASGTVAIALGTSNNASGVQSFAAGSSNSASGMTSFALGIANTADAEVSMACGSSASTLGIYGAFAYASGVFSSNAGEAQRMRMVLRRQTTNATPAVATTNGGGGSSTNQILLTNNSAYKVRASVVAREVGGGADVATWDLDFAIKRGANAASTALVGTATVSPTGADAGASAWSVAVTADTTNGCAAITVTGEASTTINWVVDIYSLARSG